MTLKRWPKHATPWSPDRSPDVFSPAPSERTWKDPICDINLYKWSINSRFHFLITLNIPKRTSGYTWRDISVQEKKWENNSQLKKRLGKHLFLRFFEVKKSKNFCSINFPTPKNQKDGYSDTIFTNIEKTSIAPTLRHNCLLQGFREASLHLRATRLDREYRISLYGENFQNSFSRIQLGSHWTYLKISTTVLLPKDLFLVQKPHKADSAANTKTVFYGADF